MHKPNIAHFVANAQAVLTKHSPEILTGLGIAGMITTTVLAVRATPKALQLIDEEKERRSKYDDYEEKKLTKIEVIQVAWKPYIPAAVTGVVSTACLIGASSVNLKRNAALATAYALSETALTEYKEQVIETVGEKKEQTIREKVNQKQLEKTPVSESKVIYTGKGTTRCLEPLSRRYFESTRDQIVKAENALNKRMLHGVFESVSINEFYDELGLDRTDTGDYLGWNTEHLIDLDITPGLDDQGEPCLVIGHHNAPKYNY